MALGSLGVTSRALSAQVRDGISTVIVADQVQTRSARSVVGVPPIASPRLRGVRNIEGGHLLVTETPGKESEPGTEINFVDGNNSGIPAFAALRVVER
jgi:hypothetical protein